MALPSNQVSTIKASGGDYTSLAAWETDLDSVNLDMDYTGEIEGEVTGGLVCYGIDGSDGSPDPYKVIIKAKAGFEADGTNESTCAKHSSNLGLSGVSAVRFEVSGIEVSDGVYGIQCNNTHADVEYTVTKCVIRDTTTTAGLSLYTVGADVPVRLGCNLLINCGSTSFDYGIKINDADYSTKVEVFNNTIYHSAPVTNALGIGEISGAFGDFRNNAVCYYDNGGANTPVDYYSAPSNVTYCAGSGDSTIPAGTGNIDTLRDDDTDWTDTSTHDFSLVSDGVLVAAGNTISESWFTAACATDMAGNAWAATPAIGCFEVVSGGQSASITDTISLSTTISSIAHYIIASSDSISLDETLSPLAHLIESISDVISLADTASTAAAATILDTLSISDTLSSLIGFKESVADTISLSETLVSLAAYKIAVDDTISLSDETRTALIANVIDTISISDSTTGVRKLIASALDTLAFVDSAVGQEDGAQSASILDTLSISDTASSVAHYNITVSDNVDISTATTALANYIQSIVDTIGLTDSAEIVSDVTGAVSLIFAPTYPKMSFTSKAPEISFSAKFPSVTFTVRGN